MPDYSWPKPGDRKVIAKDHDRIDGIAKSTGAAKYAYDINRPGLLHGAFVRCPVGAARVKAIDAASVEKMPGVKKVVVLAAAGAALTWAGEEVALVVADTEERAADAARALKVDYEVQPFLVREEDLDIVREKDAKR